MGDIQSTIVLNRQPVMQYLLYQVCRCSHFIGNFIDGYINVVRTVRQLVRMYDVSFIGPIREDVRNCHLWRIEVQHFQKPYLHLLNISEIFRDTLSKELLPHILFLCIFKKNTSILISLDKKLMYIITLFLPI